MESIDYYAITLLRHAESSGNADGIWQGQADFPLTETGVRQAQRLGLRWQQEGRVFDSILASSLSRASRTAEIVGECLSLPVERLEEWIERDNGRLAGAPRNAASGHKTPQNIYTPIGETGESPADLYLRAAAALRNLLRRPPGRYLVVSHGGTLNMALYAAFGIAPMAHFRGAHFSFGNTGFADMAYFPRRDQWVVTAINDLEHLRSENGSGEWAG